MKSLNKTYLAVLMLIILGSILGLIVIQAYWIRNSFKVNEKNFNYQVNRALSDVVKNLETQGTILEISNEVVRFAEDRDSIIASTKDVFQDRINKHETEGASSNISYELGGAFDHSDSTIIFSESKDSALDETPINISLPHGDVKQILRNKVDNQVLFVEKIINRLQNYNDDVLVLLKNVDLQKMIDNSLKDYYIDIDFEFAVKSKGKRLLESSDFSEVSTKTYTKKLYPNSFMQNECYLELFIPKRRSFIVSSMITVILISLLLMILIITIVAIIFNIILQQKKISEVKNDFVNNLTHELKTPIATISLAGQMLSDKDIQSTPSTINRYAQIIREESRRLTKQVEKVLQIALIDKGELKLKDKKIEINEFISNIAESFVLKFENEGGKIILNLNEEELYILVDELHFTNVITNLVDNALKYKNGSPEIIIETGQTKDRVFFMVQDNGIGIGKTDQQHIFDRFYRVESGNIHNIKGFGLGLSYVKKIIDIYKGQIQIKSKLKQGTSFTIYLPKPDFIKV